MRRNVSPLLTVATAFLHPAKDLPVRVFSKEFGELDYLYIRAIVAEDFDWSDRAIVVEIARERELKQRRTCSGRHCEPPKS